MRLALIRTEGEGEKSSWLLHRMKTDIDGHVAAGRRRPSSHPRKRTNERMPRRDGARATATPRPSRGGDADGRTLRREVRRRGGARETLTRRARA